MHGMHYNPTSRSIWENLQELFNKVNDTQIYHLQCEIYHKKLGTLSHRGMAKKEKQKLIPFLIGLNETCINVR